MGVLKLSRLGRDQIKVTQDDNHGPIESVDTLAPRIGGQGDRLSHPHHNEERQGDRGTLLGFDDFVNMVLEDVTEYESTPEGRRVTKLDQILLNGNNITMLVPGGDGPES